jgi:hypothetical protein
MPSRPSPRTSVEVTDVDIHGDPTDFNDVLDEDESIVEALSRKDWKKYVANFNHYIELVIDGWRLEGRRFPSEAAKKAAIASLVNGVREEAKRDPKKWIEEHCDWRP